MIQADLYVASTSYVGSGLPSGQTLSFSHDAVVLTGGSALDNVPQETVALDSLATDEQSARKLSGWLGALLGGECGVERFESGWSAWATREDGRVLEVASFGYQLYRDKQGFLEGGQCEAALREPGTSDAG